MESLLKIFQTLKLALFEFFEFEKLSPKREKKNMTKKSLPYPTFNTIQSISIIARSNPNCRRVYPEVNRTNWNPLDPRRVKKWGIGHMGRRRGEKKGDAWKPASKAVGKGR